MSHAIWTNRRVTISWMIRRVMVFKRDCVFVRLIEWKIVIDFFFLSSFLRKENEKGEGGVKWISENCIFANIFLAFLFSFAFECKIAVREKDEEINCLFEIDRRIENECSFHVKKYLEMWNEYLWILFLRYNVIFFSFSFHFHLNLHLNCSINSGFPPSPHSLF